MKTAKLFLSPLRRAKSRREGTLLTVCFSLREISLALMFFFCTVMQAQVLIGGTDRPRDGAILDLNSTAKGGLILSNVTIADPEFIPYDTHLFPGIDAFNSDVNPELRGAMVYNDGKNVAVPAGIYIWNGCSWTKDGGGINSLPAPSVTVNGSGSATVTVGESLELKVTALLLNVNYTWYKRDAASVVTLVGTGASLNTSATAEGTYDYYCVVASNDCSLSNGTSNMLAVTVNPIDPATLPDGIGTFTGKVCFDVALSNPGGSCGTASNRAGQKTNFADRTEQGGTAASVAPYSGVQVYTFSTADFAVSRVRFEYDDESGLVIDSIVPESPDYATADGINEAKVTVYYNKDLNTALQGRARADALKVKLYAIYNPKAVYDSNVSYQKLELDISLQDCSCCGAYAAPGKWLNFLCHNLGADESADPFTPAAAIHGAKYKWGAKSPALTQSEDQTPTNDSGYSTSDWANKCCTSANPKDVDWNMETDNPCPAGWRVPTRDEWMAVLGNNSMIMVGNWIEGENSYLNGYWVGTSLFLPAAGYRRNDNGSLFWRGFVGDYVCSNTDDSANNKGYFLFFRSNWTPKYGTEGNFRSLAVSVRCVAD
jgi:uncharacterized protein (TIGR02145 family)